MDYKYKISVVVPIYNTESYLRETLESIEHQTIGIENIQIILINDGSTDNSESICLEFMEKYPHNVVYRAIENGGVSRARNYGKQFMQGKYVNFFDSDDIWDIDAFFKAYNMLEKHEDIDVVAVRLKYFEASKKYHWLDYKFTGDRIIDINSEPQNIVIHMSTCLIRSEVMRNLHYDENLKVSEDTKLLYQIILQKEKYGIISSSKYNYRKRKEGNSAIQVTRENKYWYLDSFPHCHDYLINMSRERYGEVIPYVQHFIMYEIQWRLRAKILDSLTDDEKEYYVNKIKEYIMITDDDIIMFQKNISLPYKIQALKVKYGDTLYKKLFYGDDGIYINQTKILSYENITNNVELSHVEAGQLIIEGHFFPIEEKNELYYCIGNKYIKIDLFDRANNYNNFFGDDFQVKKKGYRVVIPLKDVRSIEIAAKFADNYITLKNRFIHFSRINNYSEGYYYEEKYLITKSDDKRTLYIDYRPFVLKVVLKELRFLAYIFFRKKKTKVAIQRALYWLSFPFFKNVWIFADREFLASDSAEVLFKYINNKKDDVPKKTYFALRKDSVDFKRVGKYGKTVDYHSLKYKLLFLHAKFLISSHADAYVNNEFGKARTYYVDLYRFKYIYLTHGVLLHDSSSWLNRINKNIWLNVVTSPLEYESIINGNYYFKTEQLIKTGMPRNDQLFNKNVKEENKILIMASWRSKLAGSVIQGTQRRKYNDKFKESEYCQFYNSLFNDEKLKAVLKQHGYRIKFCIHPSFRAQKDDFIGNELVEIAIDVNAEKETLSSKMLITDYSSAACDFAYLEKPVIYANFDYDHIFDIHYYNKGYFDYDENGFGPNCKSYEQLVQTIIDMISNGCKIEKKYKERCETFFYYRDNHNAQRVYEEILKRI